MHKIIWKIHKIPKMKVRTTWCYRRSGKVESPNLMSHSNITLLDLRNMLTVAQTPTNSAIRVQLLRTLHVSMKKVGAMRGRLDRIATLQTWVAPRSKIPIGALPGRLSCVAASQARLGYRTQNLDAHLLIRMVRWKSSCTPALKHGCPPIGNPIPLIPRHLPRWIPPLSLSTLRPLQEHQHSNLATSAYHSCTTKIKMHLRTSGGLQPQHSLDKSRVFSNH